MRIQNQTRIVGGGGGTVIGGAGIGGRTAGVSVPQTTRGFISQHPHGRRHRRRWWNSPVYWCPYPYYPTPFGCVPPWPYNYPFGYGVGAPGYPWAFPY